VIACVALPQWPTWSTNLLQNTKHYQTQLLASNNHPFFPKQSNIWDLKWTLYSALEATSCINMRESMIRAEELADISSYQTLPADKNSKSY
jgi:hypothetical protein